MAHRGGAAAVVRVGAVDDLQPVVDAVAIAVGAVGIGLVGVVILRITAKSALQQEHLINEDLATMRAALTKVVLLLQELVATGEEIDVYGVKDRIDDDMAESLALFADARESMIPAFGLAPYAEVMTRFAGGERMVNRAWGEPSSQLHERHDASDFETQTQDKIGDGE